MFENNNKNLTLLSGVNTVSVVALLAYTVRTFNEVNTNLEELRGDLEFLKSSFSENNKRANIAFTRLNQRIQESGRKVEEVKPVVRKVEEIIDPDLHKKADEIEDAINLLAS